MWKICAKFVPRVLREDQKERRCHDSREMVELINSDPAVLDALVTCDESWIYCNDPLTKRQSSQWKHAGFPRTKKARQSKSIHKLLMIPFFDRTGMIYMHWVPTGQTCWGFKGVQEEIPSEEASTLQIESVAFPAGQCTNSQLHPCHRLIDQDGRQDSSSASLVQTLLPVTFGYSLSSEAVVMRQLRRWKRLWRRSLTSSHKRTCMGPSRSCCNGT